MQWQRRLRSRCSLLFKIRLHKSGTETAEQRAKMLICSTRSFSAMMKANKQGKARKIELPGLVFGPSELKLR
jgi:hypothetical protein